MRTFNNRFICNLTGRNKEGYNSARPLGWPTVVAERTYYE